MGALFFFLLKVFDTNSNENVPDRWDIMYFSWTTLYLPLCAAKAHPGDMGRMLKPSESHGLMRLKILVLVCKPGARDTFWVGETAVGHTFWALAPFWFILVDDFLGRMAQRSRGNGCYRRKMNNARTVVYKEHAVHQEVG